MRSRTGRKTNSDSADDRGDVRWQTVPYDIRNTVHLVSLLDSFGLCDHVHKPTRGDHQLDVFISRSNWPAPVIKVDPPLMSDHALIVASFDVMSEHSTSTTSVTRRRWRSFVFDDFIVDLSHSQLVLYPPTDVTELFVEYDKTLADLLDKHAPWHQVKVRLSLRLHGLTPNVVR